MSRWLLVALVVGLVPAGSAQARGPDQGPGAVAGTIVLVPRGGEPIDLLGLHSYFGKIELRLEADGLVVVNRLPLERYLLGLEEVPSTWPAEALEAQAIAARTYALWTLARPPGGAAATYGFDICASVQCQVFSGADVVLGGGTAWADAVRETRGRTILYDGEPILARYHSTSGGMTLDNEQVYTSEGSFPYLQSVPSRSEGASPLYRWRTRFPLERLELVLERWGLWEGDLDSAETVPSASGLHYPDVELSGDAGTRRITAEEVRDAVRETAPELWPRSYPSRRGDGARLPETMPSNRYEMVTRRGVARVVGRGWGHGVGMSQWGAFGMASAGADHATILSHYYRGVSLGEVVRRDPIEVGVAWGAREITASGHFSIVVDGETVVEDALGSWTFASAQGATAIDPPRGFGLRLRVGIVEAPPTVEPGATATIRFALSKPARVDFVGSGARSDIFEAGTASLEWTAPAEEGPQDVVLRARAGRESDTSSPVTIQVAFPPAPVEASPQPDPPASFPYVQIGLLGLAAAIVVALVVTIR